jgi:hypothetical protein
MSTQRSWTSTWPSTLPETGTTPAPAQATNRPTAPPPPRAPVTPPAPQARTNPTPPPPQRPAAPPSPSLGRPAAPPPPAGHFGSPPTNQYAVPAHQTNNAVLADLARQARAARGELQAAQETFARRALALFETLRIIDDSLVQLATHVLGNTVIASAWFSSRNHHLNQRSPLEVLMVGDREAVVTELMRLEHGAY